MEGSEIKLFTCILRNNNYYYKCLVKIGDERSEICCSYMAMGIKGIVEHLSFNHGISPHRNIDFYIIYESSWFSINEDSE